MSVDYYLASPGNKRSTMIGSVGFFGVQVWDLSDETRAFLRWAIEENVRDVVLLDEFELENKGD